MSNFIMTDTEFVEVVRGKQSCCPECDYIDNEILRGNQMFIKAENTYATHKARNAAYKAFMEDLQLCQDEGMIEALKAGYIDLFSKLREEQQQGIDTKGFDYIDELRQAVERRKQEILANKGNENVYSG